MRRSYCLALLLLIAACAGFQAAAVTGVLTDQKKNPVPGIRIFSFLITGEEGQLYTTKTEASTVSGADGKYSLGELPDLSKNQCRFIVAYIPGRYLGWTMLLPDMPKTGNSISIIARPVTTKFGSVVDQKGQPLANVHIKYNGLLVQGDYPMCSYLPAEVIKLLDIPTEITTGKDGTYIIIDAAEGAAVLLTPNKKGFAAKNLSVDQSSLKIVLVPAGKIAGQVLDADGKPLKDAQVTAGWEIGDYPNSTTTDTNGQFLLEDLTPGEWRISVGSPGHIFIITGKAKVKAAQTTQVPTIKALATAEVTGKVIYGDSGKPAEGVKVTISRRALLNSDFSATGEDCVTTDANGSFKAYASIGWNSLIIYEAPTGYVCENNYKEITVPKTGLSGVTIKLKKAAVAKGRVVDEDGKPVESASVSFDTYGSSPALTDAEGRFTITLSPADRDVFSSYNEAGYTFNVRQKERNLGVCKYIAESDINANDIVITVKPIISAKVHVTLPSGKPAAGARLRLITEFNHITTYYSPGDIFADASGNAVIKDLIPGAAYSISVSKPGYFDNGKRPKITTGTAATNIIEIRLQPAKRVQKGKVIDGKGKPVANVVVNAEGRGMETIASTKTDANGKFILRGLPDCSIQITAEKGSIYGSMSVDKSSGAVVLQITRQFSLDD
ncbi:MAG: carboxypeptidase-like regulatory domain-containing protein [Armatimonadota bacterium]